MIRITIAGAFVLALSAASAHAEATPAGKMLERLASLEGQWSGTLEWSGARTDKGTLQASYYVTGNGSAVVENLIMHGKPSMTSVYHLDGADLRMTHYCAARNQPRLKADKIDGDSARFAFIDVTNVGPQNKGHVEGATIRIVDADNIVIEFVFQGGGPRAVETIKLRREPG
jgi:hypothetical protein